MHIPDNQTLFSERDLKLPNPFDRNLGSGDPDIVREISGQALRAPQERKASPFRQRAGAAAETA